MNKIGGFLNKCSEAIYYESLPASFHPVNQSEMTLCIKELSIEGFKVYIKYDFKYQCTMMNKCDILYYINIYICIFCDLYGLLMMILKI